MRRLLALTPLTLLAAACSDPASPTTSAAALSGPSPSATPVNASADPLDLAVIGDVPYGSAIDRFPTLVSAINADPTVRLVVHIGDIKSGSTLCSDEAFEEIARQFTAFADPLIYAIGDNEWTDCHRANNGGYEPLGRLAKLRAVFFANPGSTLGGRNMGVEPDAAFPENQLWVSSRVTFATLHILGSNNGLDPWFGAAETPQQQAAQLAEYTARNAANIAWLEHAFDVAREQGSVGVALFFQADLWHPDDRADGAQFTGHQAFVERLAQLAAQFDGPVLLVAGDSHDYRVDVGVPWFSLYGVTPPANVTQVIVDRTIEDDTDWLRLHVDPRSPEVFSWKEEILP